MVKPIIMDKVMTSHGIGYVAEFDEGKDGQIQAKVWVGDQKRPYPIWVNLDELQVIEERETPVDI